MHKKIEARETANRGLVPVGISLNGRALATSQETLAALLDEQGYGKMKVATAVNGDFVPEQARSGIRLAAGDRVEVVSVRQGG